MDINILKKLQALNPKPEKRVDIRDIVIDQSACASERAKQFLSQINPYAFRCGKISVNVEFSPDGRPLEKALYAYFRKMK